MLDSLKRTGTETRLKPGIMSILRLHFTGLLDTLRRGQPGDELDDDIRSAYTMACAYPGTSTQAVDFASSGITLDGALPNAPHLLCGFHVQYGLIVVGALNTAQRRDALQLVIGAGTPPPSFLRVQQFGSRAHRYFTPRMICDLTRVPLLSEALELKILTTVQEALLWLHSHSLTHNDVAARNVLLSTAPPDFACCLGDFDSITKVGTLAPRFALEMLPDWAAVKWGGPREGNGRRPGRAKSLGCPHAAAELDWVMLGVLCCVRHQQAVHASLEDPAEMLNALKDRPKLLWFVNAYFEGHVPL